MMQCSVPCCNNSNLGNLSRPTPGVLFFQRWLQNTFILLTPKIFFVPQMHALTLLCSQMQAPDPFIIQKSRQLNRRVTLNVGGVRHEVREAGGEVLVRSRI